MEQGEIVKSRRRILKERRREKRRRKKTRRNEKLKLLQILDPKVCSSSISEHTNGLKYAEDKKPTIFQMQSSENKGITGADKSSVNIKIEDTVNSVMIKENENISIPYSMMSESEKSSVLFSSTFTKNKGIDYPSTSAGNVTSVVSTARKKHPPELKGKAIGMWYRAKKRDKNRALGREKKEKLNQHKEKKEPILPISVSSKTQNQISNLLYGLKYQEEFRRDMEDQNLESENLYERYSHIGDSYFKRKFLRIISGDIKESFDKCLKWGQNMEKDVQLDRVLHEHLNLMWESSSYKRMLEFRRNLPAFARKNDIVDKINNNQVVLISGETGCGKTTQVAQFILDDQISKGNGSRTSILCTQPRRISAVSIAERVAAERGERLGESVGFHIRLERKLPRNRGSILYATTAMLLQFMQSDPALLRYSHIIIDEIHERSTHSDFVVTLLKEIVAKRPKLKIVLMSATLNSEKFSRYFDDCPIMHIPGFTYPVEEFYLEDILMHIGFQFPALLKSINTTTGRQHSKGNLHKLKRQQEKYESAYGNFDSFMIPYIGILRNQRDRNGRRIYSDHVIEQLKNPRSEELSMDFICEVVKYISFTQGPGAILIFLPGLVDISKLNKILSDCSAFPRGKFKIFPLHSRMPTIDQKLIFESPPPGVRKIIIATSIAETSITIEDVVYVIECGRTKLSRFDSINNIETLLPEWVTKANAIQRRGRAGRVRPGKCFYLYSRARFNTFDEYPIPELLRTRLDELILQLKILQLGKAADILNKVMDPPDAKAVEISLDLLRKLNALDQSENLTPLGYHLAQLPLEPRTGKMIIWGAMFGCVDPIFSIAASLSFKDAFYCPLGKEKEANQKKLELGMGHYSDHIALAEALRRFEQEPGQWRFCKEYFLSWNTLKLLSDLKKQFAHYLQDMKFLDSSNYKDPAANRNSNNVALVKAIVCAGLYPNVAVVKKATKNGVRVVTPEKEVVKLHPSSINAKVKTIPSPYLVYYLKRKSTDIFLLETSGVNPVALLLASPSSAVVQKDDKTVIEIANGLYFNCEIGTAILVQTLNEYMDNLLEKKVNHPGVIDWGGWEGKILRAIITLISEGDQQLGFEPFSQNSRFGQFHAWDSWDEACASIDDEDEEDDNDFFVYN